MQLIYNGKQKNIASVSPEKEYGLDKVKEPISPMSGNKNIRGKRQTLLSDIKKNLNKMNSTFNQKGRRNLKDFPSAANASFCKSHDHSIEHKKQIMR